MGELNFSRSQCIRALTRIGFYHCNKRRRAKHEKYCPPAWLSERLSGAQPRFIMIPRHEVHCQSEIITELKVMGGEDLVAQFSRNL